jgi:ATP-binding cassette subfamily F protein uup
VKEYEGGYDDYLRQRPAGPAETKPVTEVPRKNPFAAAVDKPRRLSFKERQELESLPGRIEALERQVAQLHDAMADPSFYRNDREQIAEARGRLEQLEHELAAAFDRWHVLEERAG